MMNPYLALRRQPALAAVGRAENQPISTDHPAVLGVGEVDGTQPGGDVLPDLGPLPRGRTGLALEHLPGAARDPRRAVGELLDGEQRVDEGHAGVDLDRIEGPALSAIRRTGDVTLQADRDRFLRALQVNAEQG